MWMYSLMIFQDSRLAMNIMMLRYMNGTKTFHGWLICHGWVMDLGWNLVIILNMFASHFCSKIDMPSGPLAIEKRKNIAMVEIYPEGYEESSNNARTHCSLIDEWEDFERANHIGSDANSNYNPYLDVSRIFNDRAGTNNDYETRENKGWFDEHKLIKDNNDDDIDDLEHYLIRKDHLYYVNEEEERSKERRCKLLGIPYVKPPT
ncbi:hypothetical protein Tco_0894180 [Tanacetum coccineum]|uniref:Uncharacterized protein n=1 Tax=Tanacetum coccineum TaxID=301880 RepID=A0ABQ5CDQ2_9ASTR